MNKFVAITTVLFLISIGTGVLLIQGDKTDVAVTRQVTFAEYQDCMDKNINQNNPCLKEGDTYGMVQQAKNYFASQPACIKFMEYSNSVYTSNQQNTAYINSHWYYNDCYNSNELKTIALRYYECLYKQFLEPQLQLCSGLY
ncbi:transmembrane protein, putative (macronuclear) [Tetrahymena thermophila SB210]|uniref:Transmembrane protein, putative n=1 Tax=Tetrahymena thermophila (strain SB210) TaxID=312017 RepID=Q23Q49_TETTS|nr:transmembrane protein, putative [Tetrahymena thermophila SB210]EAR98735.1 transmembrane protein, putative [Tetrahymena thermophila SB210]|eukprot:XP_001018980.1 transmembrane protein, putative [Tetrahymena thermophila SB210]